MTRVRFLARSTFRSMQVRNFRHYMVGQAVSSIGTWMQAIAQTWLVLSLTNSGVALGITVALQFAPLLVAGLWAGVIVERHDRRRILLVTQIAAGATAALLAAVVFAGIAALWMIYALALSLGVITAIENPARRVFISELVPASHLPNAISLSSAVFTLGRVVGPALAGLLIAASSTGWCFLANAVSYGVAVIMFLRIRTHELVAKEPIAAAPGQVRESLRYVWNVPELRAVMAMSFIVGMITWNYQITLPLFSERVFHGDAATFGAMFAVLSLGSVIGALVVAQRNRATLRLVAQSVAVLALFTTMLAVAPALGWGFVVLIPVGMAGVTFVSLAQAFLQLHTRIELRARVMALFGVVFLGSTPIGGPIIGFIAERFGARSAMGAGAAAALTAAAIGWSALQRARAAGSTAPEFAFVSRVASRPMRSAAECPAPSSSASPSPSSLLRAAPVVTTPKTTRRFFASDRSNRRVSTPSSSWTPRATTWPGSSSKG